jgi:cytidyltransferase-like protein
LVSGQGQDVWVYADGVCDLFHHGHVEFFRQARLLGTHLVVGVLSDVDTMEYKPKPIMSYAERVAVVRGCRHVDRVLDDPPPLRPTRNFLDTIGAAFLVHGDDMPPEELRKWYGDLIEGGRLRTVRYTSSISSRQIVERIAERLRDGSR